MVVSRWVPVARVVGFALAVIVMVTLVQSCAGHRRVVVVHHPNAKVVTIKRGHVHSARCGHYKHGNRWYVISGHVHKRGCGHRKVRGVWVIK